ncbi:MAG: T9SS type A sorting domain-containing protein, partial [Bacteroidales bacterium]|nr:T9SS type A sorting domain-containing protein [Bacteroidales bacterium]
GCDQTSLGLTEQPQLAINLYPNPATQYVVLDMGTGEELDGWVTITDMQGKRCLQQKAEGASIRLSVAGLPTGMYFLTYTGGKSPVTRKFLKK